MLYGFNTISDIFDDAVYNLFGSSLDDFFSDPSNTTYSKKSFSSNGHNATVIRKTGKDGQPVTEAYVDNKRVKELPDWALEGLDNAKALTWRPSFFEPIGCNNKLPDPIVSGTEIPKVNILHGEDGSMRLEFGLIGVDEDRIEITSEDNYLLVNVNEAKKEEVPVKYVYLQKGLKNSDGKLWKKILIDPKKYDINSLVYEYKNGKLVVTLKKSPEPEKNRLIFKKAAMLESPAESSAESSAEGEEVEDKPKKKADKKNEE